MICIDVCLALCMVCACIVLHVYVWVLPTHGFTNGFIIRHLLDLSRFIVAATPFFQHANLFFYRGSQARSRIDKLKKFRGMTGYDRIQPDTTANAARALIHCNWFWNISENNWITSLGPTWIGLRVFAKTSCRDVSDPCASHFSNLSSSPLLWQWVEARGKVDLVSPSISSDPKIPEKRQKTAQRNKFRGFLLATQKTAEVPPTYCGGLPKFTERRRVAFPCSRAWFTSPAGASDAGAFVF